MRQILLLPLAALLAMPVFSQTPADTTLTIRNIEIQGTRFAGLSERLSLIHISEPTRPY